MKLNTPAKPPIKVFTDIYGNEISVSPRGKMTLVAFFRDVHCPFCNFRIFELTNQYRQLEKLGLNVIAVFSATDKEVKKFIAQRERPFPVVADPESKAHELYGLDQNKPRSLASVFGHFSKFIKGMKITGKRGMQSTSTILPADFLIDKGELIIACHYGKNYGDRMPLAKVKALLS